MNIENKVKSFVPAHDMPMAYRERQEKYFYAGYKVICLVDDTMWTLVDARLGGTVNCIYASVWLETSFSNPDFYNEHGDARASAKAGGYGYHRASAALESAFNRAGMRFSIGCSGMGESMMRDCLLAAGEYLKPENAPVYLVECYG